MSKNMISGLRFKLAILMIMSLLGLYGCGENNSNVKNSTQTQSNNIANNSQTKTSVNDSIANGTGIKQLNVTFGDDGDTFKMTLEDNDTAKSIAGYVGTSSWRLPVYDRDESVDYSVMQYYDIPSRYKIPSSPVEVTKAYAGEVYYSEPNRILLFYHDADISEQLTKVGMFEADNGFISAVENNPVLKGWGNKIIQIKR